MNIINYVGMMERLREQANIMADILSDPENQQFIEETNQGDDLELLLLMAIHFERELAYRVAAIHMRDTPEEMGHTDQGSLH